MPFDSAPVKKPLTRTQKLERLLYHLNDATDEEQKDFCDCLAHRCYADPILQADGLPPRFWYEKLSSPLTHDSLPWYDYFGFEARDPGWGRIFGASGVAQKRAWIKSLLAKQNANER